MSANLMRAPDRLNSRGAEMLQTMIRRSMIATVCALLFAPAACTASDNSTNASDKTAISAGRTDPPTRPRDCNGVPPPQRDPGYVVAGFDWNPRPHPLGRSAVIYVCFAPWRGALVVFQSDHARVIVEPYRYLVPDSSNGVIPFHVTVNAAGTAKLQAKILDAGGRVAIYLTYGAGVTANETTWHFTMSP